MTTSTTLLSVMTVLIFLLPTAAHSTDVPERGDIDAAYKWDLSDMYVDTDAWEADRDRFIAALPNLEQYRGQLGTDGATLLAAIESTVM